jgi:hypothetical protein
VYALASAEVEQLLAIVISLMRSFT